MVPVPTTLTAAVGTTAAASADTTESAIAAEGSATRVAWTRPAFEAFDTALEVTAYAARD